MLALVWMHLSLGLVTPMHMIPHCREVPISTVTVNPIHSCWMTYQTSLLGDINKKIPEQTASFPLHASLFPDTLPLLHGLSSYLDFGQFQSELIIHPAGGWRMATSESSWCHCSSARRRSKTRTCQDDQVP
jgi:hypothetical protein